MSSERLDGGPGHADAPQQLPVAPLPTRRCNRWGSRPCPPIRPATPLLPAAAHNTPHQPPQPRRSVQQHYRGAIRSGFVSHADEDDEEVLSRIRAQALRDADWLVNKVGAAQVGKQRQDADCSAGAAGAELHQLRRPACYCHKSNAPPPAVQGREGGGAAAAPQGPLTSLHALGS